MRWTFHEALKEDCGHTLVETVVALALLLTVLIPVGGTLHHLATQRTAPLHSEALMLARAELEQTLSTRQFVTGERWDADRRWRIKQTVTQHRRVLDLRVEVYRGNAPTPLVSLYTQRLAARMDSPSSR